MKKLLWIGCLENDEEFKNKSKKGYNLASAQVSQQNLIKGIENKTGLTFDSINGSVLPPFPIYRDKIIKRVEWSHSDGAYDVSVGYKNKKYINRIECRKAMIEEAHKWVKTYYKGEELIVIVYSMRSAAMATACEVKKLVPNSKIYLIVTDLPQFMDLGQSKLKAFLKKIDWINIKKMQNKVDFFILYASKMAHFLNIPNDKWILMEGSFDIRDIPPFVKCKNKPDKKAIMYSGMIEKKYGLELLIEAFKSIPDQDLELWITGGGNDVEYIKKSSNQDSRIKFFGFLPSRREVLIKQQEATILINMRLPSELASSYCFPSKLFEYMVSGTPVLSFRLEGIPKEYFKYLIVIEEETKESLVKTIYKTLNLNSNEMKNFGDLAKSFIIENKTLEAQCQKIVSYLIE